jgi:hypothetical protein
MEKLQKVLVGASGFVSESQNAEVIKTSSSSMLLRLVKPIESEGQSIQYVVVQARHENTSFEGKESGDNVLCNLTATSLERVESGDPFDLSWWRGGNATITDVTFV